MASGMFAVGSFVPTAMAATTSTNSQNSSIVVNNEKVATSAMLQRNGLTYVPVWYVINGLKTIGLHSRWTGGDWFLSTSSEPVISSSIGKDVPGQVTVYLNSAKLASVPTVIATDPGSKNPTTYVPVSDLTAILQKADVFANWTNGSYQLQTPAVQALDTAFQNTQNAVESQMTANLTEQMHFTVNPQSQSATSKIPQDMTLQMQMTAETGTVNGAKAVLITITPQASAVPSSALPKTIQEYIQGSRVWLNQGQGWVEQTNVEQLIQSLQSQMPLNEVNFNILRNIESSIKGTSTNYTATLDSNALGQMLTPIMNSIAHTSSQGSSISSSQMASLLNAIIKQMKGALQITVQPTNGQDLISSEQLTLDMMLPMSTLETQLGSTSGTPAQSPSASANSIQSISIHETMTGDYTYNNNPIVTPTGIGTSSTVTGQ